MKKVVSVMLFSVAALSMLAFSSCKGKKSEGKVELTVWESTNGPDEFIRQAGTLFEQSHPNISIKYVNVELGDAVGQIALDGPAGKGPDLFAAPHDRLGSLAIGGHVLATDKSCLTGKELASCVKALTYEGTMYGYPVSAETYALFYNKKLISENEVPKTWEELRSWARNFNDKNPGKYGFVMNAGEGYYSVIFTTGKNNRLFGENGTDRKNSYLNSEAAVEGMTFFQTLRSCLDVPANDLDTASVDGAFQSGNAALHVTGLWNVVPFKDAGLDFGVAPLPSLPGEKDPAASFSGTRAMFVSAYSDHPKEANEFAAFLMSDEMQNLRFQLTGALPGVDIPLESPYTDGFLKQLSYAFPMPSIPEMAMFWEAMNNASKNIWNGADVKAELDACNDAMIEK